MGILVALALTGALVITFGMAVLVTNGFRDKDS